MLDSQNLWYPWANYEEEGILKCEQCVFAAALFRLETCETALGIGANEGEPFAAAAGNN